MKVTRPHRPFRDEEDLEKAHELGYGKYFVKEDGGETVDDHIYVNKLARIPCVDIINYDAGNPQSSFGSFWHTVMIRWRTLTVTR